MSILESVLKRAEGKLSIAKAASIDYYFEIKLIHLDLALIPTCNSNKEFLNLVILSAFRLAQTNRRDLLSTIKF